MILSIIFGLHLISSLLLGSVLIIWKCSPKGYEEPYLNPWRLEGSKLRVCKDWKDRSMVHVDWKDDAPPFLKNVQMTPQSSWGLERWFLRGHEDWKDDTPGLMTIGKIMPQGQWRWKRSCSSVHEALYNDPPGTVKIKKVMTVLYNLIQKNILNRCPPLWQRWAWGSMGNGTPCMYTGGAWWVWHHTGTDTASQGCSARPQVSGHQATFVH